MEGVSITSPGTRIMHTLRTFFSRWTLWYGITISWFAVTLGILTFAAPSPNADSIVYLQLIVGEQTGWLLFLLPLAGLTLGAALAYRESGRAMRAAGIFVGTVTVAIVFLALLGPIIGHNSELVHVDRVRSGGHVYNLAYKNNTEAVVVQPLEVIQPREYILYECDRYGIRCDVLFRYDEPSDDVSLTLEHGTIVVTADDSEVYTVSPD